MPTNNRHEWSIEYRESAALTTIDGFLVAHHGQCHITTRSDLELPTKSAEIRRLLAFLTTIHNDSPDVYLYASPPRDHAAPMGSVVPENLSGASEAHRANGVLRWPRRSTARVFRTYRRHCRLKRRCMSMLVEPNYSNNVTPC
jgi:hypothetical protein